MLDKISLSILNDYSNLEDFLVDLKFSKSQIKKYVTKKELARSLKKKIN